MILRIVTKWYVTIYCVALHLIISKYLRSIANTVLRITWKMHRSVTHFQLVFSRRSTFGTYNK